MDLTYLDDKLIERAKEIHERCYKTEFAFPDFRNQFYAAFAISNSDGELVTVGGVRPIAESILITDKRIGARQRRKALVVSLDFSKDVTKLNHLVQLHAFVQDDVWKQQLINRGFASCKGDAIYINV